MSTELSWSTFPLNISIDYFAVKYTEVKTGVSVYLPLQGNYERSYRLQQRLRPNREFVFQIIALTESGLENITYSSENVSITTPEGGKHWVKKGEWSMFFWDDSGIILMLLLVRQSFRNYSKSFSLVSVHQLQSS